MSKIKTCKVKNTNFSLQIELYPDLKLHGEDNLDFQGSTIELAKPLVRNLVEQLKTNEHREILVPVLQKEYMIKISVDKVLDYYRIMDNERAHILGYIEEITLTHFLNNERAIAAV